MTLAYAAVAAIALLCAAACAICWKVAYADGHEAGRLYERNRFHMRQVRANRAQSAPAVPAQFRHRGEPWYTVVTPARVMHGGIGGPSTVPIAHLRTDTGSFRAATDQFIAALEADGEEYRRGLGQEINA